MTENQRRLLLEYVTSAEPRINRLLRNGKIPNEVEQFDEIFDVEAVPHTLFRLLPNECVSLDNDKYCDLSYLSTSASIDNFIDRIQCQNLACFEIITSNNLRSINVQALLPNQNNEEEYILPRGLELDLQSSSVYEPIEYGRFLERVHCDIIIPECLQLYYSTITLYTLTMS